MRKSASIVAIVAGILMALAGVATWFTVSNTLSEQKIVVSEDANCLAGNDVDGPFSAYCQAKVIDKHTKEITGGKTYAELDRDDPNLAGWWRTLRSCKPRYSRRSLPSGSLPSRSSSGSSSPCSASDPRARHGLATWRVLRLAWRDRAWERSGSSACVDQACTFVAVSSVPP